MQYIGATIPDPRRKRGIRHAWTMLLLMICLGLLSGQRTLEGIGDWVYDHAAVLEEALDVPRLPSHSTLRRAAAFVEVEALEHAMRHWGEHLLSLLPEAVQALALDGKAVRGAQMHGQKVHLLSVITHEQGIVMAQQAVEEKTNEIPGGQHLLASLPLAGRVVTGDAMHTQHATIAVIRRQHGHYLLTVKENQPGLYTALEDWFAEPAWGEEQEESDHSEECAHGRDERRTLTARLLPAGLPGWPSVRQAMRRMTWRRSHRTGQIEEHVTYAITDLTREQANAHVLATNWRGHWTIENRLHYVRDVTWGEDASQCAYGSTAQALAALRNGLLSLLRVFPVRPSIASSLRLFASSPLTALSYLFADHSRLCKRPDNPHPIT